MHPNCKYLANIFPAAYGVLTKEGEGTILDEVSCEDWFGEQV
jgi:hypothetical protein